MALHPRPQTLKVLFSGSLVVCLAIAPVALAAYKPQKPSRPSGSIGNSGVRGSGACSEVPKGDLTVLAPLGHIGQATTTHPSFAWYVPDAQSYPIRFSLYSFDRNGKAAILRHRYMVQSVKGIQKYTLPSNQPGLIVGQKYLWQVRLLCQSGAPSKDVIVEAEVETVAMPALLQSALVKISDRVKRANLYAESGFWYDALAEALTDTKTKPFSIALLQDLIKLETSSALETAQTQSKQLQQVIELEP